MTLGEQLGAAGLAVGVVGVLITLVGFIVAVRQLRRTATASEATRVAVERTERRTALNHLLVLLPQFRLIESDLDYATESEDRKLTMRALVAYAHIAHEVSALLRDQDGIDASVLARLEATARAASRVKAELVTTSRNPKTATREVRVQIAEISSQVTGLASNFRIEAGRT